MKRIISNEDEFEIIRSYKSGESVTNIAKKYHVDFHRIADILDNHNIRKDMFIDKSNKEQLICKEYLSQDITQSELAKQYNMTRNQVYAILKKYKIFRRNRPDDVCQLDVKFFDIIDTEEKAYVLGLIYADGNISQKSNAWNIRLQETDKDILQKISEIIRNPNKLYYIKYDNNWQNQYCLQITNKHMHDSLISHGAIPNKSLILKFDRNEMIPELYRHFIRGYFDGDGTLVHSKHDTIVGIAGTNDFCSVISEIIQKELNIPVHIYKCRNNDITKELRISGVNNCRLFLDWIYNDSKIYMDRKFEKYCSIYNINDSLTA